jgi:hypothetical protein
MGTTRTRTHTHPPTHTGAHPHHHSTHRLGDRKEVQRAAGAAGKPVVRYAQLGDVAVLREEGHRRRVARLADALPASSQRHRDVADGRQRLQRRLHSRSVGVEGDGGGQLASEGQAERARAVAGSAQARHRLLLVYLATRHGVVARRAHAQRAVVARPTRVARAPLHTVGVPDACGRHAVRWVRGVERRGIRAGGRGGGAA